MTADIVNGCYILTHGYADQEHLCKRIEELDDGEVIDTSRKTKSPGVPSPEEPPVTPSSAAPVFATRRFIDEEGNRISAFDRLPPPPIVPPKFRKKKSTPVSRSGYKS